MTQKEPGSGAGKGGDGTRTPITGPGWKAGEEEMWERRDNQGGGQKTGENNQKKAKSKADAEEG